MEVVEVVGCEGDIIEGVCRLRGAGCRGEISLEHDKCLSGLCYAEEILYACDGYPCNVIGPVRFIWTSVVTDGTQQRKLVMIVHPSISGSIVTELGKVFGVISKGDESGKGEGAEVAEGVRDEVAMETDATTTTTTTTTKKSVVVTHHKLDFVMFSLTGPLSGQLLQNILTRSEGSNGDTKQVWSSQSENDEENRIFNLTVEDPRFHIPKNKKNPFSNSVPNTTTAAESGTITSVVSDLWDEDVRNKVKEEKLTDQQINNMRSKQLVPGSKLDVPPTQIPLVIMEHGGEFNFKFSFSYLGKIGHQWALYVGNRLDFSHR